jgi:hypothetical protein
MTDSIGDGLVGLRLGLEQNQTEEPLLRQADEELRASLGSAATAAEILLGLQAANMGYSEHTKAARGRMADLTARLGTDSTKLEQVADDLDQAASTGNGIPSGLQEVTRVMGATLTGAIKARENLGTAGGYAQRAREAYQQATEDQPTPVAALHEEDVRTAHQVASTATDDEHASKLRGGMGSSTMEVQLDVARLPALATEAREIAAALAGLKERVEQLHRAISDGQYSRELRSKDISRAYDDIAHVAESLGVLPEQLGAAQLSLAETNTQAEARISPL